MYIACMPAPILNIETYGTPTSQHMPLEALPGRSSWTTTMTTEGTSIIPL